MGKMYYENGKVKAEWKIIDGKEVYHREYYENGQPKERGHIEDDKGLSTGTSGRSLNSE
ncbi:MAG: hypothetical protein DRG83_13995 [Deltaproteobacteria bacterium]|nr:MAG: hypothetical protein DRG83_13995 [Deltaproteobacteria bacterium]